MWLKRIFNSFLGIRSKSELEDDIKKVTLVRLIILFLALNITFISIIYFITSIILS